MRMLLSTYAKIFRDILSSRRCLLALDDLQYMHSQSTRLLLQVLSAPVARSFNIISPKSLSADVRAMGHVEHRYNVVIVGCNNTSSGNQTQNSWLPNSSDLRGHTGIFRMKLEALNDLAIAQLAASVFQCSSITPELSKFLSGLPGVVPLQEPKDLIVDSLLAPVCLQSMPKGFPSMLAKSADGCKIKDFWRERSQA